MTTPQEFFDQDVPDDSVWRPFQHGYGIAVRILRPASTAVLGRFILGTDKLAGADWVYVTDWVRGIRCTVGAPEGRPGAGECFLTFDNRTRYFSPASSIWNGPGTQVQVLLQLDEMPADDGNPETPPPTRTRPLWSGIIDDVAERTEEAFGDLIAEFRAVETLAQLSMVNNAALTVPIGTQSISSRMATMLASADFQYSYSLTCPSPQSTWLLQADNFAQNMLSVLYATCDSLDLEVYTRPNGSLFIYPRPTPVAGDTVHELGNKTSTLKVIPESVIPRCSDRLLLKQVDVARAGGTAKSYLNPSMSRRYSYSAKSYTNLRTVNPGADQDLDLYGNNAIARSKPQWVQELRMQSAHSADTFRFLVGEIVTGIGLLRVGGFFNVRQYHHRNHTDSTLYTYQTVNGYELNITVLGPTKGATIDGTIWFVPSTASEAQ